MSFCITGETLSSIFLFVRIDEMALTSAEESGSQRKGRKNVHFGHPEVVKSFSDTRLAKSELARGYTCTGSGGI